MLDKSNTILDWVDQFPETESVIREYDEHVGVCILCQCLFESIEEIESIFQLDLNEMYFRMLKAISSNELK
ncbi:MAG: hypothetical protein JXR88_00690 [Clostridia bacterium]|nr:hypothetical protein [Clostridia bacterium]